MTGLCVNRNLYDLSGEIILFCSFLATQVFTGNFDRDSIVRHNLHPPIRARCIRFQPIAWSGHISMRVELYGC